MTSDCALGLLSLLGIGFHSYLDGVTYAISSSVSTFTGALVALGMVVHEFAEGVVTYALLLRGGFSERRSFLLAFAAGDVSTPLGTLTSFAFVSHISEPVLGLLLSLSAGTLVYVGATHLLPGAVREPRKHSLIALIVGALVAIGIILAKQWAE